MTRVTIADILNTKPVDEWEYNDNTQWDVNWSDVYPSSVFKNNYGPDRFYEGYTVSPEIHDLLKFSDITFKVFFEDRSCGQRLVAMFMDNDPVVVFEGEDSWGGTGNGPWIIDPIRYDVVFTILSEVPSVEAVSLDTEVESRYYGLETPADVYYS